MLLPTRHYSRQRIATIVAIRASNEDKEMCTVKLLGQPAAIETTLQQLLV